MDDQSLKQLMRQDAPYIADEGFTDKIVQALPRSPPRRRRPIVLLVASVIAIVVGLVVFPGIELVAHIAESVAIGYQPSEPLHIVALVVLGLVSWGCVSIATTR